MMKSPLLALAIASLSAIPALGADLPYRKGPPVYTPPPPPIFTWTGFYVGLNAGGIIGQDPRSNVTGNPHIVAGLRAAGFSGGWLSPAASQ